MNKPRADLQGDGSYEFDIVGESFYQDNLLSIAGKKKSKSANIVKPCVLQLDQNNKHDKNAVSVWIDGLQVGHLSKTNAKKFRDEVSEKAPGVTEFNASALIVGGWVRQGSEGDFGVKIDLPITNEEEPTTPAPPPPPQKKKLGCVRTILIIFLGACALMLATMVLKGCGSKKETAPAAKISKEERAANAAAQKKAEAESLARYTSAKRATTNIKRALRDPNSVQWISVLTSTSGKTACIQYRARNGYGGMSVEQITFLNGNPSESSKTWNKHCANKPMHNLKHAAP